MEKKENKSENKSDKDIFELVSKFHGLYSQSYKPLKAKTDSLDKSSMSNYLNNLKPIVKKFYRKEGNKQ